MNEWHDLFVATTGAAAALTGLVFVGVSINVTKILSFPNLSTRALLSLTLLMTILVVSILLLIPDQSLFITGIEVIITGIIAWFMMLRMDYAIYKTAERRFRKLFFFQLVFDQVAVIPYTISGIIFLNGDTSGVTWLALAFILSFIKSMIDAWILLIEINR
jgi:modulator of FtsH protease